MANIPLSELDRINLDEEWQSIQNMVNGGITPSADRIREYIQVSCLKGNPTQEIRKVVSCIADILRLEETFKMSYCTVDSLIFSFCIGLNKAIAPKIIISAIKASIL